MARPTADELREHLAYEVHLLVWAAIRFRTTKSKDKMIFQDSALMHARNLLEFTKPTKPRFGWWIVDVGGPEPQDTDDYRAWNDFINANVTHLGDGRLRSVPWPVAKDEERLVNLSTFALKRIRDGLDPTSADPHIAVLLEVARLGLDYLNDPSSPNIGALADLVGG
jgi:hypothetical protein